MVNNCINHYFSALAIIKTCFIYFYPYPFLKSHRKFFFVSLVLLGILKRRKCVDIDNHESSADSQGTKRTPNS